MPFKYLKFILPMMFLKFSVEGDPDGGGGPPSETKPPKPQVESFSREYVQELRHENASYRTKAAEEARKAAEAEDKATKALEEATGKITAATTQANERIIRAELKASAIKAGMVDLDGLKLADLSTVKLNDAGEVEGAETLMEEMKKAKPYLFGTTISTTNTGTPPKRDEGKPKSALNMSKEEYAAEKENIKNGKFPVAV